MSGNELKIEKFTKKLEQDLFNNIIPFWLTKTKDTENGGFYGRITNDLKIEKNAPKSLILHSRILWAFSFLYEYRQDPAYLDVAKWAYDFIINKFFDDEYGGMYWMLDAHGVAIENHKKMYGQAFTIYAFAEYYKVKKNKDILNKAVELFNLIEKNNYDKTNKGYYEGSFRNWLVDKNVSLSAVDMKEVKSMNTHLHIMEAYTSLFNIWPDENLKSRLIELVEDHLNYIIDPKTKHLKLFFDEEWNSKSKNVSFGHDIEASWLLCEAVEILADSELKAKVEKIALDMVDVTSEQAFDEKDAIYAEKDSDGNFNTQLEWWQQAEAMVGFVNAYQLSGDEKYLDWAIRMWNVIEKYIIDDEHGEWFYSLGGDGNYNTAKHKVSEWKGPYHNVRACVEVMRRLQKK